MDYVANADEQRRAAGEVIDDEDLPI